MPRLKLWFDLEKKDLSDRLAFYPKRKFAYLLLAVLLLLITIFRIWLGFKGETVILQSDLLINRWLTLWQVPILTDFFSLVSLFGEDFFIGGLCLILVFALVLKRRKRAAFVSFLTLGGSYLLIYLFKDLFSRPRPNGCLNMKFYECFSFPSGHAALSFYFYSLLIYLLWRFAILRREALPWAGLGWLFLISGIAFSRLYLGVHYFSDVFGGFLLGGIWLLTAVVLIDFLYTNK